MDSNQSTGNSVISADQAREITGGRQPFQLVPYEQALRLLDECQSIDDAKYWNNYADAWEVWSRIKKDTRAEMKARALKILAFEKAGKLSALIRPGSNGATKGKIGQQPGPRSLLLEAGFTDHEARAARRLALMSHDRVREFADQPRPPSPVHINSTSNCSGSDGWKEWSVHISAIRALVRRGEPHALADRIRNDEIARVLGVVVEVAEWLDDFERHLKKRVKK